MSHRCTTPDRTPDLRQRSTRAGKPAGKHRGVFLKFAGKASRFGVYAGLTWS
ncbi:MAG: hypothetical protein WAK60_01010 [Sedimentisphaerales bacterium]